ncbi:MAG TPA: hypothetical protein PK956_01010 [Burkholderiaceae bacterium]|jgi:hypothetical protein|nr:hypothetical protein [Burkholderiaceae bacterium]HRA77361.1 hypothetical protein [Burkholderiaceae bacterium]
MSSIHSIVRRLAMGGDPAVLREDVVFIKTRLGRDESRRTDTSIPRRLRTLLALVDGRRSVGELRAAIHSYRGLDDGLDMLRKMGFIEPLPERWDQG